MKLLAQDETADKYGADIIGYNKENVCFVFVNFFALYQFCTVFASHGEAEQEAGEQDKRTIVADREQPGDDRCKYAVYVLQIA